MELINVLGLIAALVGAVAAVAAAVISWTVYKTQISPEVIVYATHDDSRPSIILLIIENIGRGLAKEVHFHLSESVPSRAFGMVAATASDAAPMRDGPLIEGIRALGPGGKRVLVWGQYGGLERAIKQRSIYVTCVFKDARGVQIDPVECILEVRSFLNTDAVDPDGARRTAKATKKVASELAQIRNQLAAMARFFKGHRDE